jgi:hypothetical protein
MDDLQKMLKEYANLKSKYFELKDGQTKQAKFVGAEIVPNHFDGGKTKCMRFYLESEGTIKSWDRVSRDLVLQMSNIPKGSLVQISRTGDKRTKYIVERMEE